MIKKKTTKKNTRTKVWLELQNPKQELDLPRIKSFFLHWFHQTPVRLNYQENELWTLENLDFSSNEV